MEEELNAYEIKIKEVYDQDEIAEMNKNIPEIVDLKEDMPEIMVESTEF